MEPGILASSITTTSGQDFFNSIRYETSPPHTLVDGFDQLVHAAASSPLRRGDVIEVQGVSGSGKTHFLIRLAVNALLPRKVHVRLDRVILEVNVGGKEETVVWIDCCVVKLEIEKIVALLRHHLVLAINTYRRPKGIGAPTEEEVSSLVEECLTRLHVFNPTSTLQLAATVQTLPEWYRQHGNEEIGFVLIDGMTEFAWSDQFDRETSSNPKSNSTTDPIPLQLFTSSIAHVRQTLSPLIFITQWVLRPSHPHSTPSQQSLPFYRHHFNPPLYPSLSSVHPHNPTDNPLAPIYFQTSSDPAFTINWHLTLHPAPKGIFRKGVSFEQVLKEGKKGIVVDNRVNPRGGAKGGLQHLTLKTTEGIVCVLRENGGKELGSWEMSISEDEIVA